MTFSRAIDDFLADMVSAGIPVTVGPHTMRHAFADHIARYAPGGIRTAQLLLGHADVSTTQGYLGDPTLDEIAAMVAEIDFLSGSSEGANPLVETVGIEPTVEVRRELERVMGPSVEIYAAHFRELANA